METKTTVTIQTRDFQKVLSTSAKLINRKNALPILGCLLLRYDKEKGFSLTSSNSDAWLTMPVQDMTLLEHTEDGKRKTLTELAVCLPTTDLQQAVATLPDMLLTITLTSKDGQSMMQVDYQTGSSAQGGHFSLPTMPADEYPAAPVVDKPDTQLTQPAATLLPLVKAASVAVATDKLRPVMETVAIDINQNQEEYAVVASDGHMMIADRHYEGLGSGFLTGQPDVLKLHKSILGTLQDAFRTAETLTIRATPQVIVVTDQQTTLTLRQTEGRYPNWQSAIPQNQPYRCTLSRQSLMGTVRRTSLFANDSSNMIRLAFSAAALTVTAEDYDFSKTARESVALQDTTVPDGFQIGLKAATFMEVLSVMKTDNVVLHLSDATRAIIIREEDKNATITGLCMPMLLNQ
ncbi:MAG: hypothetical protein IJ243_12115 [Prevotella sp.]|nr:hypothetical protein [Prevotella sp.]